MEHYRFFPGFFDVGCHDGSNDAAFCNSDDTGGCSCLPATEDKILPVDVYFRAGVFIGLVFFQWHINVASMANAWFGLAVADDGKPECIVGGGYINPGGTVSVPADKKRLFEALQNANELSA